MKLSDHLSRLTIEPRDDKDPITMRNLLVKLNGEEVKGMVGLTLRLENDEINEAEITLAVGQIKVDASVVRWLEAQLEAEG